MKGFEFSCRGYFGPRHPPLLHTGRSRSRQCPQGHAGPGSWQRPQEQEGGLFPRAQLIWPHPASRRSEGQSQHHQQRAALAAKIFWEGDGQRLGWSLLPWEPVPHPIRSLDGLSHPARLISPWGASQQCTCRIPMSPHAPPIPQPLSLHIPCCPVPAWATPAPDLRYISLGLAVPPLGGPDLCTLLAGALGPSMSAT